jgi:hypothetical protein
MESNLEKKYPSRTKVLLTGAIFLILALCGPPFLIRLLTSDTVPSDTWPYIETPLPAEIKSVNWDDSTHQIKVTVENIINETVTLGEVYANETLDSEAVIASRVLSQNQTTEIILSQKYVTRPNRIDVIITTNSLEVYKRKIFYEIGFNLDWDEKTGKIRVTIQNSGDEPVTLSEVYVKGVRDVSALPNPISLESKNETTIILKETFRDTNTPIRIKVTTIEGIYVEISKPIYGLWIQSINWNSNTGNIVAYVYKDGYLGTWKGEIAYVYVNGTLDSSATIHDGNGPWTITSSKTYVNKPEQITIKVVTSEGTFGEKTMTPPNEF